MHITKQWIPANNPAPAVPHFSLSHTLGGPDRLSHLEVRDSGLT